jgi:tetratricopeptide (TPR) repeat protein
MGNNDDIVAQAHSHFRQGNAFFDQGRFEEAAESFRNGMRLNRMLAGAYNNEGIAQAGQGQVEEAMQSFREALRINPNHVEARYNLGNALKNKGELAAAEGCYRQALRINAAHTEAHTNLGNVLRDQGKLTQAVESFQQALRLNPDSVEALNNVGLVYKDIGKLDEAIVSFQQALGVQPRHADILINLGSAFEKQRKPAEALACYRQVSQLDPHHAMAHNNMGSVYFSQGLLVEAAELYRQALASDANHKLSRWNLALWRLLQGELTGGWPDYEQRLVASPGTVPRVFQQPRWDGAPLEGKTILVYAEQGLGDTLQFIRYASLVKARGGRVLVECQPALARVFEGVAGIDELIPQRQPLPPFDVQVPLLSLPGLFHTTLATIPASIPYLRAEPDLVQAWQRELQTLPGFKIGIVWQGNPKQGDDHYRSAPLRHFAPLAQVPGVRLLSLQVGHGREQLAHSSFPITDLGNRFDPNSLHDLAAVLMNLDLVVTVCTSAAHLAGALGRPGWVALRYAPDWRWFLDRSDSPWYPTLRLFRQSRFDDWSDVFEHMASQVRKLII